MNYIIEKINENNAKDYARVNALAWKQSNKGFILYIDNKAVGMLRIGSSRQKKYNNEGELRAIYLLDESKHKGFGRILFERALKELKEMGYNNIIIACLKDNPSNEFYKHMGGKLVDTNQFNIPNQQLEENVYYFENI